MLRERYPEARIVGVDSSLDMIEAARKRLPDIAFEVADIREWRPGEPLDMILANAVLHFASEARSAKSTGNILNVDGGVAAAFPR